MFYIHKKRAKFDFSKTIKVINTKVMISGRTSEQLREFAHQAKAARRKAIEEAQEMMRM